MIISKLGGSVQQKKKERKNMQEEMEKERQKTLQEAQKRLQKMRRLEIESGKKDYLVIIAQSFYGNRTATRIRKKNIDRFILGILDDSFPVFEAIDRTVIKVPGTKGLVFIYNRYREAKKLRDAKKWYEEEGYVLKPVAEIPEMDLKIYSRCIACRMTENGVLEDIREEDGEAILRYFTE